LFVADSYSKEEGLKTFSEFDFLLTDKPHVDNFNVLAVERAYERLEVAHGVWPVVKRSPAVYIHKAVDGLGGGGGGGGGDII